MRSRSDLRRAVAHGALAGAAAVITVLAAGMAFDGGSSAAPASPEATEPRGDGPAVPPSGRLHPEIHAVTAASPTDRGWVLLDGREGRVHRLDAEGRHVLTFGRPGRGPGELDAPAALLAAGDTVFVAERTGGRLHRFTLEGAFVDTRRLAPPGCLGGGVVGMARMGTLPLLLFQCLRRRRRGSYAAVYALEVALRPLAELPLRDFETGSVNPFRMPLLAADSEGFYLGVTTEPCLVGFDTNGRATARVCHPWSSPVPLPRSQRDRLRSLRRRLGALGPRLDVPEVLPPFDRVFLSAGRPVFLTIQGMETRSLEVLENGELRRLSVPAAPSSFVGDSSILVARERVDGTWIAVYPI